MWEWPAFVTPFLLPISFLWDIFSYITIQLRLASSVTKARHAAGVAAIQQQVRAWRTEGRGAKMCTARPSWMSISQQSLGYKDNMYKVAVGDLQDVLAIDREELVVQVEPGITIGHLNRVLHRAGLTLPVVPELDTLTIGGLLMGGGIESTSHRHGLFHRLATRYELVTAEGELLEVTEASHPDIFRALPMSYGTLGYVVGVSLRVLPHRPFIRLEYFPTSSLAQTTSTLERLTRDKEVHSVEGIAYSKDTAVIMAGRFVTKEEVRWEQVNRLGLWFKPWFYQHVATYLGREGEGPLVEYVPTLHFHQRHNKPCFWLAHLWAPWGSWLVARLLVGWLFPLNHQLLSFLKEKVLKGDAGYVILQDFLIPIRHLGKAIQLSDEVTGVYPLWMVPASLDETTAEDPMFVDLGVYGWNKRENFAGKDAAAKASAKDATLRRFERFTIEHGGFQALYAETLMSYEEFNQMFAEFKDHYWKAKSQLPLSTEAFPEVYEKVSRQGRESARKARDARRQD